MLIDKPTIIVNDNNEPGDITYRGDTGSSEKIPIGDAYGVLSANAAKKAPYWRTTGNLIEVNSDVLTIIGGEKAVLGNGVSLQVKKSSASQDGYLGKDDWTIFSSGSSIAKYTLSETNSGVLTISGGISSVLTNDVTIQVKKSSTSQDGYLGKDDWATFNTSNLKWQYINRSGFVDPLTTTSISFNPSNYTFTLSDNGSGWKYFRNGTVNSISGNKTVVLSGSPPDAGSYYIFIDDNNGTLTASTSTWSYLDNKIPVSYLIWDNNNTPKYQLADERHSCLIDVRMHKYLHQTRGTQLIYGGVLSGYVVSPVNPIDSYNTFAITQTQITDEDIYLTLDALLDPSGTENAYTAFYRTGSFNWSWQSSSMPFLYESGSFIKYDNSGTITTGQDARFYNYYLLFTNIDGEAKYSIVPGRSEFLTADAAYSEQPNEFDWSGFIIQENIIAYQLTFETNSSFTNKGKCRFVRDPYKINIPFVTIVTSGDTIDHDTLGGLQGGFDNERYHLSDGYYQIATTPASSLHNGFLTSTDWSTFNNKVSGPISSTDNAIALFNGINGNIVKNSLVIIDSLGNMKMESTSWLYHGDPEVNGTWRTGVSDSGYVIEKRESGSWVVKGAFA